MRPDALQNGNLEEIPEEDSEQMSIQKRPSQQAGDKDNSSELFKISNVNSLESLDVQQMQMNITRAMKGSSGGIFNEIIRNQLGEGEKIKQQVEMTFRKALQEEQEQDQKIKDEIFTYVQPEPNSGALEPVMTFD